MMRKTRIALLVGSLGLLGACDNFLDVNTNPNAPTEVAANLYLAPMEHWMVTGQQYDGRFIGRYAQEWILAVGQTSVPNWERMGYDAGSDNGGQQWRDVYWSFGQNLNDMMKRAEAEQRWDLLGVGYVLKAYGWHVLAGVHGEIIIKEAIDPTKTTFNYDSQEFAYQEVLRLLDLGIASLQRTDGAVDPFYMARGDRMYNGDRQKWLKFAYGLKAMNLNHYTNKASYKPAEVISLVDKSFASNADDALLAYPNTNNDDSNFYGAQRANINAYRQAQFIVNLMNGTQFGGVVDPRMSRMLAPSPDGQIRGLDPNVAGFGALSATQQPVALYGRYVFDNKVRMPAMSYAQLQFIKAEAAYRLGNKQMALDAYKNGISAHIDFVNARNAEVSTPLVAISTGEKNAFLANPAIVPASAADLTLSMIMSQKYIAQWGWGHDELWMDMRRYHYTDVEDATGKQIFLGYSLPTNLFGDNGGKPAYRIRPRYNSEYVWNRAGLDAIGGLDPAYHTKLPWIIQP